MKPTAKRLDEGQLEMMYDKSPVSLEEARKHIKSGWMFEGFKYGKYDKER